MKLYAQRNIAFTLFLHQNMVSFLKPRASLKVTSAYRRSNKTKFLKIKMRVIYMQGGFRLMARLLFSDPGPELDLVCGLGVRLSRLL